MPQIWNPKSGFVFNSNNTPFEATGPADNLKPSDFPAAMGIQTNMTNRAYRAEETFGADHAMTDASFRAHKFDLFYSKRSKVAHIIAQILAADASKDDELKAAQNLLRHWDFKTNVQNRATALAVLTCVKILPIDGSKPVADPLDALHQTIAELKNHFGRIDPAWGQVNRIRRGKVDLAIDGAPDIFRAVYGAPQSDGTLTAARRRHLHHVRDVGQEREALIAEHPPIRLGDPRPILAALRRSDAALRGNENKARAVH